MNPRTATLMLIALVAFASNSLLTRFALGSGEVDAATFTSIRLAAGAVVLALAVRAQSGSWQPLRGANEKGPLALFLYAVPFSFAYLRIGAATGALVLFGVVQLTMIVYGLLGGERPTGMAWAGLLLAAGGLVALTLPSAKRPDTLGLGMMSVAGVAWAGYTLAGRGSRNPLAENARSFLFSTPPALAIAVALHASAAASTRGVVLGLVCGGVTSGLGYAVWYRALPRLSVMQAAVAQLSVPVIAAIGAACLLGEDLSTRLLGAGAAVLCGVALVLVARSRKKA